MSPQGQSKVRNQRVVAAVTAFTGGRLKIESENPFAATFESSNGLGLLVTHESLPSHDVSVAALSGWIAHPMRQSAELDHWVATISRSLLGASLSCLDATPNHGYVVEVRTSLLADCIDEKTFSLAVDVLEMATAVALRDLHAIESPWARPIRP